MANAGLIVYNNNGNLVIDSTFKNLVFITKGSVATGTAQDTFSIQSVNLNGLSGYPMVAVSAPGGAWAVVRSYSSGAAVVDIVAHGPVNTNVNYWVFALPTNAPTHNGLAIWDASGALVFSTEHTYMKMVDSYADLAGPSTPTGSLTLPAGKTYAVMQTNPMAYARNVDQAGIPGSHDWYLYSMRGCFAINGNVMSTVADEFQITHYGPSSGPNYQQGARGFAIDVTGL